MRQDCLEKYVKEGASLLQKLQSPVPIEDCDMCEMQVGWFSLGRLLTFG